MNTNQQKYPDPVRAIVPTADISFDLSWDDEEPTHPCDRCAAPLTVSDSFSLLEDDCETGDIYCATCKGTVSL